MDVGIVLAPAADFGNVVRRAEALGYRRAWFYDTQLLNDELFAAMAAAAVQESSTVLAGTSLVAAAPDAAGDELGRSPAGAQTS
jgi:hypothetical protein